MLPLQRPTPALVGDRRALAVLGTPTPLRPSQRRRLGFCRDWAGEGRRRVNTQPGNPAFHHCTTPQPGRPCLSFSVRSLSPQFHLRTILQNPSITGRALSGVELGPRSCDCFGERRTVLLRTCLEAAESGKPIFSFHCLLGLLVEADGGLKGPCVPRPRTLRLGFGFAVVAATQPRMAGNIKEQDLQLDFTLGQGVASFGGLPHFTQIGTFLLQCHYCTLSPSVSHFLWAL